MVTLLPACLAALLAGALACSAPPPPLPPAEQVAAALGCGEAAPVVPVSSAGAVDTRGRPPVDIYLDASASMRGFVTPARSAYVRVLQELLGRLASAGYTYRAHAFCEDSCARDDALRDPRRVYEPSFYTGRDTPLAELLTGLAQRGGSPGSAGATLILSDMEQSGAHTDQRALVQAFRRLAERAPQLLLLSFQAEFQDPAQRRRVQKRPFYLLAVAPGPAALAELQRLVLSPLQPAHAVQPALPPVAVRDVRLGGTRGADPAWGTYRRPVAVSCGPGPAAFAAFLERHPPREAEADVRLQITGDLRLPIRSPADFRYEVRRASLRAGRLGPAAPPSWQPVAQAPAGADRASRDGEALLLTVPAPRPAPMSWDAYRIRVRAGGGNLEAPPWVRDSTGPLAQGKTPNLDHLVLAMQQAITEDVVFLDLILALGRGE